MIALAPENLCCQAPSEEMTAPSRCRLHISPSAYLRRRPCNQPWLQSQPMYMHAEMSERMLHPYNTSPTCLVLQTSQTCMLPAHASTSSTITLPARRPNFDSTTNRPGSMHIHAPIPIYTRAVHRRIHHCSASLTQQSHYSCLIVMHPVPAHPAILAWARASRTALPCCSKPKTLGMAVVQGGPRYR